MSSVTAPNSSTGSTAWLYDGQATKDIGLHDSSLTFDIPLRHQQGGAGSWDLTNSVAFLEAERCGSMMAQPQRTLVWQFFQELNNVKIYRRPANERSGAGNWDR